MASDMGPDDAHDRLLAWVKTPSRISFPALFCPEALLLPHLAA